MKETLIDIFSNIGVTDVLDICVVAFIVYKILAFIRESRAQQLVKGIIALVAAYLISDLLDMHVLNWILKGTMTMGVVALIVLFQPELRRGLEYIGRGRIMGGRLSRLDKSKAKLITDEIVRACDSFSESRTGALIVIERDVTLGDIAETGTVINAEISTEMIGNIFYKGAPLHDGAVIIRDDRIYAAGCVLPLTASLDLNKELGTRHRAGIGITENSDAVVLIVSEETGVISVARGGRLTRFLDSKGLKKLLLNLYLAPEDEKVSFISRLARVMGDSYSDRKSVV